MNNKLKLSKLRSYIQEAVLQEAASSIASDLLPGSDGKLSAYSTKVEKFIQKTIDEAATLAEEGEELMKADHTRQNPSVGERNRFLLTLVGYLRKMRFNLSTHQLDLRKMLG